MGKFLEKYPEDNHIIFMFSNWHFGAVNREPLLFFSNCTSLVAEHLQSSVGSATAVQQLDVVSNCARSCCDRWSCPFSASVRGEDVQAARLLHYDCMRFNKWYAQSAPVDWSSPWGVRWIELRFRFCPSFGLQGFAGFFFGVVFCTRCFIFAVAVEFMCSSVKLRYIFIASVTHFPEEH